MQKPSYPQDPQVVFLLGYPVGGSIFIVSSYGTAYMQPHRHCEIPCQAKLFLQFVFSLQFDYHQGVWSFKKDQRFPLFVSLGGNLFSSRLFFLVKAETKLSFQLLHRLIFRRQAEGFSCLYKFGKPRHSYALSTVICWTQECRTSLCKFSGCI